MSEVKGVSQVQGVSEGGRAVIISLHPDPHVPPPHPPARGTCVGLVTILGEFH